MDSDPLDDAFTSGYSRAARNSCAAWNQSSSGDPSGQPLACHSAISQRRDVLVPEDRDAVFIHSVPVRLLGMPVSLLGVLESLPGALLPGLVILFLMGFRGATVSVGGTIVQLGGPLMIFVMRSVVITSRHYALPIFPDLLWDSLASLAVRWACAASSCCSAARRCSSCIVFPPVQYPSDVHEAGQSTVERPKHVRVGLAGMRAGPSVRSLHSQWQIVHPAGTAPR